MQKAYVFYLGKKFVQPEQTVLDLLQLPREMLHRLIHGAYLSEIQQLNWLRTSDIDFVSDIVTVLTPFQAAKGQVIYAEGDVVNELIFISRGLVHIYTSLKRFSKAESNKLLLGVVSRGEYFGDMEYCYHFLSLGSYTAAEKCTLYSLSFTVLRDAFQKHAQQETIFKEHCTKRYALFVKALHSDIEETSDRMATERETVQENCADHNRIVWVDGISSHGCKVSGSAHFSDDRRFVSVRVGPLGEKNRVEETLADLRKRWIIHPLNSAKSAWDLLIFFAVALSLLSTSIVVCFDVPKTYEYILSTWVIDALFFIDIIVVSRTAYFNEDEELVTVPHLIFFRYLKGWFFVDLLSSIPFDDILDVTGNYVPSEQLKLVRVIRFVRLFKVNQWLTLLAWFQDNLSINPGVLEIMKLLVIVTGFAHVTCCLWWALGGVISKDPWYNNMPGYPDLKLGNDGVMLSEKYVASLYWVLTTLATVGFGDIVPVNAGEQVIACVVMLLGGVVFGYIVGNMTSLLMNLDKARAKENEKRDMVSILNLRVVSRWPVFLISSLLFVQVKSFLEEKRVSHRFSLSVMRHFENLMSKTSAFDGDTLLSKLPPYLASDIMYFRNIQIISKISLFRYISNRTIIVHIFRKLVPVWFNQGQRVITEGDRAKFILMLMSGKAELLRKIKVKTNSSSSNNSRIPTERLWPRDDKPISISNLKSEFQNVQPALRKNLSSVLSKKRPSIRIVSKAAFVSYTPKAARTESIGFCSAGDYLGCEELLSGIQWGMTAKALTYVRGYALHQSTIESIALELPEMGLVLQRAFALMILQYREDNLLSKIREKLCKEFEAMNQGNLMAACKRSHSRNRRLLWQESFLTSSFSAKKVDPGLPIPGNGIKPGNLTANSAEQRESRRSKLTRRSKSLLYFSSLSPGNFSFKETHILKILDNVRVEMQRPHKHMILRKCSSSTDIVGENKPRKLKVTSAKRFGNKHGLSFVNLASGVMHPSDDEMKASSFNESSSSKLAKSKGRRLSTDDFDISSYKIWSTIAS